MHHATLSPVIFLLSVFFGHNTIDPLFLCIIGFLRTYVGANLCVRPLFHLSSVGYGQTHRSAPTIDPLFFYYPFFSDTIQLIRYLFIIDFWHKLLTQNMATPSSSALQSFYSRFSNSRVRKRHLIIFIKDFYVIFSYIL